MKLRRARATLWPNGARQVGSILVLSLFTLWHIFHKNENIVSLIPACLYICLVWFFLGFQVWVFWSFFSFFFVFLEPNLPKEVCSFVSNIYTLPKKNKNKKFYLFFLYDVCVFVSLQLLALPPRPPFIIITLFYFHSFMTMTTTMAIARQ